jgi:hypothetical protein
VRWAATLGAATRKSLLPALAAPGLLAEALAHAGCADAQLLADGRGARPHVHGWKVSREPALRSLLCYIQEPGRPVVETQVEP